MSNIASAQPPRTLDEQRREFIRRRFLAMPLAGLMAWAIVGVGGIFLRPGLEVWLLFIATGFILYLGLFLSRFTGEDFLRKNQPPNEFGQLFFYTVAMAMLVYSLAIPFFLADYTSLPLTVGILSGLMWLPLSWMIKHWIGIFHAFARTAGVLIAWYLFPKARFIAIPAVIVVIYTVTIIVLEFRWRASRIGLKEEPATQA